MQAYPYGDMSRVTGICTGWYTPEEIQSVQIKQDTDDIEGLVFRNTVLDKEY